MLKPIYQNHFECDMQRAQKRGKDLLRLKEIILLLVEQKPLPAKCRDHMLSGIYKGRRECHVEPDWLLIYKPTEKTIIFERLGSHADLFG